MLGLAVVAILAAFGLGTATFGHLGGAAPSTAEILAGGVGVVIAIVMAPVAIYAVWRAAVAAVLGEPATARSILQDVSGLYFRLWLLMLGYGVLILLASLLAITCFLIPLTVWILVKWCVVVPAWFVERHRLGAALSRSWELAAENWWRLFGTLLLFFVLYEAVSGALGSFSLVAVFVPREWAVLAAVANVVVEVVLGAILAPLFPLVLTLLYFDLRVRHEHLDLEMMAREVSGGPPGWVLPPPPGQVPA